MAIIPKRVQAEHLQENNEKHNKDVAMDLGHLSDRHKLQGI
jgi:hypothetical protein